MTFIVPLIIGALLSADAFAQESDTRKELYDKHTAQLCDMAEQVAETAMQARQAGVPLSQTRKELLANLPASKESAPPALNELGNMIREVLDNVLLKAYELPRQPTELLQRQAVEEYRDIAYLECVREAKDGWNRSQQ